MRHPISIHGLRGENTFKCALGERMDRLYVFRRSPVRRLNTSARAHMAMATAQGAHLHFDSMQISSSTKGHHKLDFPISRRSPSSSVFGVLLKTNRKNKLCNSISCFAPISHIFPLQKFDFFFLVGREKCRHLSSQRCLRFIADSAFFEIK